MGGGDTDWTRVHEGRAEMRARTKAEQERCDKLLNELMSGRVKRQLTQDERLLVIRALRAYKPTGVSF